MLPFFFFSIQPILRCLRFSSAFLSGRRTRQTTGGCKGNNVGKEGTQRAWDSLCAFLRRAVTKENVQRSRPATMGSLHMQMHDGPESKGWRRAAVLVRSLRNAGYDYETSDSGRKCLPISCAFFWDSNDSQKRSLSWRRADAFSCLVAGFFGYSRVPYPFNIDSPLSLSLSQLFIHANGRRREWSRRSFTKIVRSQAAENERIGNFRHAHMPAKIRACVFRSRCCFFCFRVIRLAIWN